MCGLFGWVGLEADPLILQEIAQLASRRGPDCSGVYIDGELWRGCHTRKGCKWTRTEFGLARTGSVGILPFQPKRLLLGHFRLSTSLPLTRTDLGFEETQPLQNGNVILTHNGSVGNYAALVSEYALDHLETGIDSEALLALIQHADGSLERRLAAAVELVDMGSAWALALTDGAELLLVNHGLHLFTLDRDGGCYWCSVQPSEEWEALEGMKKVELTANTTSAPP
jgi:asparagine synthetase B (glutamine-hydrolysing)